MITKYRVHEFDVSHDDDDDDEIFDTMMTMIDDNVLENYIDDVVDIKKLPIVEISIDAIVRCDNVLEDYIVYRAINNDEIFYFLPRK